ncbi:MAG: YceI family protein [Saprospiraceae bacterium]|nr:YceI family protein [Saprospiraceae bacterium]HMW39727.1 YceI family protein [Saprospiraceae bacterium]HMX88235.1 YceI family protein [Saprospiraceae bacterium]HMZ40696.1 YceI family protein [Saprospiraceae bacterium]HNA65693.1 YceI family protein [Saprospiraceae bacterium]
MLHSFFASAVYIFLFYTNPEVVKFTVSQHKMSISGTSTMHDWAINVRDIKGSGQFTIDKGKIQKIENLTIEIPVQGLISHNKSSTMDNKTHEALLADQHPLIQYKLMEVTSINSLSEGQTIQTRGNLTIAGNTRAENLDVQSSIQGDGSINIKGTKKILMTDYGIKPPKAMFNTLSTGNEVTIEFNINLKRN